MILILHTAARYLTIAAVATAGTLLAGIVAARHLCRSTPEQREQLGAVIADLVHGWEAT